MIEWLHDWIALIVASAAALSFGAVKIRDRWAGSNTNSLSEKAKQAGEARYISLLEVSQLREKEAWTQVAALRVELDLARETIANYREDLAESRTRDQNCERELNDLRAQVVRNEITKSDEMRTMRNASANQEARIRSLAKQVRDLGGNASDTNVFGRIE